MFVFLALHFDGTFDLTAIGTLLLAAATFISLLVARGALKSSQEQIKQGQAQLEKTQAQIELGQAQVEQTQEEIALSRAEVEEAHRPVIIPIVDHRRMELGLLGTTERVPRVTGGEVLIVPVENIGAGPALRLDASATPLDTAGTPSPTASAPQTPAEMAGLGKGSFAPLEIRVPHWTAGANFELAVTYEDVAGKTWVTRGRWIADLDRYVDVRIAPSEARSAR